MRAGAEDPGVITGKAWLAVPRLAESRYILPSFVERTSYGVK